MSEPLTDEELGQIACKFESEGCPCGPCSLVREVRRLRSERAAILFAEHRLSDAYLRLRALIPGAFDTTAAPSAEQIWAITENALDRLRSDEWLEKASEELGRLRLAHPPYILEILKKHRDGTA